MSLFDRTLIATLPLMPKAIVQRFSARYIAGERDEDAMRVVRELNQESVMGTVDILGEHISLKKKIALKVLHTDIQVGEEARQRFQREGIAAGQFTHPNAIQIFDFDMDEGPVF